MSTAYKLSNYIFGLWSLVLVEDSRWRYFLGSIALYYWLGRNHVPEDGEIWERMIKRGEL